MEMMGLVKRSNKTQSQLVELPHRGQEIKKGERLPFPSHIRTRTHEEPGPGAREVTRQKLVLFPERDLFGAE